MQAGRQAGGQTILEALCGPLTSPNSPCGVVHLPACLVPFDVSWPPTPHYHPAGTSLLARAITINLPGARVAQERRCAQGEKTRTPWMVCADREFNKARRNCCALTRSGPSGEDKAGRVPGRKDRRIDARGHQPGLVRETSQRPALFHRGRASGAMPIFSHSSAQ